MQVQEMLQSHPHVRGSVNEALVDCIEACLNCAQTCVICADACLGENKQDLLKQCIRLNLDCADLCIAAAKLGARRTGDNEAVLKRTLQLCAVACGVCADECARHAGMHEHCRICAETCRLCQRSCADAAQSITPH